MTKETTMTKEQFEQARILDDKLIKLRDHLDKVKKMDRSSQKNGVGGVFVSNYERSIRVPDGSEDKIMDDLINALEGEIDTLQTDLDRILNGDEL
jgi:hypothetical protein